MIGILSTDNIADLKPLGDRILVEVSPPSCKSYTAPVHSPQRCRVMIGALSTCSRCLSSKGHPFACYDERLQTQSIVCLSTSMSNCVRAILQIDEAKDETDSGLLLTSSSKEQPTIGKVCLSACQWVSRQGYIPHFLSCMTTRKSNC